MDPACHFAYGAVVARVSALSAAAPGASVPSDGGRAAVRHRPVLLALRNWGFARSSGRSCLHPLGSGSRAVRVAQPKAKFGSFPGAVRGAFHSVNRSSALFAFDLWPQVRAGYNVSHITGCFSGRADRGSVPFWTSSAARH